jgi:hypothetical protein
MLRKIFFSIVILASAIAAVLGALWFKYRGSISPDLLQHAQSVWLGQANLLGDRTPGELIRYAKRRLQGHPNLEMLVLPPLHLVQAKYERPLSYGPLPTLGKGQQTVSLPAVQYTLTGRPAEALLPPNPDLLDASTSEVIVVDSAAGLVSASKSAQAGHTIMIAPGRYLLNARIDTNTAGTRNNPITIRAARPGQVTLEFNTEVAFRVSQPYWVFENLHIRGVCGEHRYCEHAFHIFGAAQNTVVRNNLIEDFNAHLKINGSENNWPDFGLIQYNTLTNTGRRDTDVPVTPIDLVGAKNWRVSDNLISNFVKRDGNQVSYGVFMKGGSSGGRIERNLVICTPQNISQPGVRVGISFGGGTTGKPYCRNQLCDAEHTAGLVANNIVAHCNDFGIDVNLSRNIWIAHNTLINTAGVDVRGGSTSVRIYGNLLDGSIRQRESTEVKVEMNELLPSKDLLSNADALEIKWRTPPGNIPSIPLVPNDFCGHVRESGTLPGALAGTVTCPDSSKEH